MLTIENYLLTRRVGFPDKHQSKRKWNIELVSIGETLLVQNELNRQSLPTKTSSTRLRVINEVNARRSRNLDAATSTIDPINFAISFDKVNRKTVLSKGESLGSDLRIHHQLRTNCRPSVKQQRKVNCAEKRSFTMWMARPITST